MGGSKGGWWGAMEALGWGPTHPRGSGCGDARGRLRAGAAGVASREGGWGGARWWVAPRGRAGRGGGLPGADEVEG